MLPNLAGEEGENLAEDGIESLADLRLLVHLHVQAVGHLVVLPWHRINEKFYRVEREGVCTNPIFNLFLLCCKYEINLPLHSAFAFQFYLEQVFRIQVSI